MNIAFLGTGLMGAPMAKSLLDAGHQVFCFNRTRDKAEALVPFGAVVCDTPQEAIKPAEGVVVMVTDARAVEEVLFSGGTQETFQGKTVIQMSTIASSENIQLQKKVYAQAGEYLEAPVLGSIKEAENKKLIVLTGATRERFEKWLPVLRCFGENPRHIGDVGKASAIKLALNQLIASHAAAFSLSLGIVEKNEIDVDIFMDILKKSALFAPMFEKKLPNWLDRKYDNPNFPARHLRKDVGLIMQEAKDKNLRTEVLEAIAQYLDEALEQGLGNKDYSSFFNIINNIDHD